MAADSSAGQASPAVANPVLGPEGPLPGGPPAPGSPGAPDRVPASGEDQASTPQPASQAKSDLRQLDADRTPPAEDRPPADPSARREIPEQRTERSRTFDNGDGTFTTQSFLEPINVVVGNGFEPVDTTLTDQGDRKRPVRTKLDVDIAKSGASESLATLRLGDSTVGFQVVDAKDVPAEVDGSIAIYRGVLPSVDIELQARAEQLKETIVLVDSDAPDELSFDLRLVGLSAELGKDRGVQLLDKSGQVVATIPAGFAVDAAGARTEAVAYTLEGSRLTVSLDRKWRADPGRKWPIRVDPTIQAFYSSGSTTIRSCRPNETDTSLSLWIGRTSDPSEGDCQKSALVKFDNLNSLINHAWILKADLTLYNWASDLYCRAAPVYIHRIVTPWSPGVTWNTQPLFDANPVAWSDPFAYACGGQSQGASRTFDVKWAVQDWADGALANHGFEIRTQPGGAPELDWNVWKAFNSAYAVGGPHMEVRYTQQRSTFMWYSSWSQQPTKIQQGTMQIGVRNDSGVTWTQGSYKLSYKLYDVFNNPLPSQSILSNLPGDIGPGQTATVDVTVETMNPGWYILKFSMYQMGASPPWFAEEGSPALPLFVGVPDMAPVISYMSPSGVVPRNNPWLMVYAHDPDSWPADNLTYDISWCEDPLVWTTCNWRSSLTTGFVDLSTAPLRWSQTVYWHVTVRHGNTATTSVWLPITPIPSQPTTSMHLGADPQGANDHGVSLSTGNYTTTVKDLEITAAGPPLAISRTYNSLDSRSDTMFGRRMSTSYDTKVIDEPATNTVLVVFPDGHQERFGKNPDGTFVAPVNSKYTLQPVGVFWGVWWNKLTLPDGTRYDFDGTANSPTWGKLQAIENITGQYQQVIYTNNKVTRINSIPSNRGLDLTWTADQKHVGTVSTASIAATGGPSVVSYTYVNDNLTQICGPRSPTECSTFTWGTDAANDPGGFNRLTKMTTPGVNDPSSPDFVPNTSAFTLGYRVDGTVYKRVDGTGKTWTYDDDRNSMAGLYHAVSPSQIYSGGNWANGTTLSIGTTSASGFPTDGRQIQAVVANITVQGLGASPSGFFRAYAPNRNEGSTSVLNFNATRRWSDQTITIPVDSTGTFRLKMYGSGGTTANVFVDLLGWYANASTTTPGGLSYHPTDLTRIIDTRDGAVGPYETPWGDGMTRTIQIAGNPLLNAQGVPASKVKAVAVNVQSVNSTADGNMIAWAHNDAQPPNVRTLERWNGKFRSNATIVKVGADGAINLKNAFGSTDVIIDVYGWYGSPDDRSDGSVYQPATSPLRTFDSRQGYRIGPYSTPWAANESRTVNASAFEGLSTKYITAVNVSLIGVGPAGDDMMIARPNDRLLPTGSSLLVPAGFVVSNTIQSRVASDGSITISNGAASMDAVMDTFGGFYRPGRVLTVGKPLGSKVQYSFDGDGRLTTRKDELSNVHSYTYAYETGLLTREVDEIGMSTDYLYDTFGRITRKGNTDPCPQANPNCGPQTRWTHFAYEAFPSGVDPRLARTFRVPTAAKDARTAWPGTDNTYATYYHADEFGQITSITTPAAQDPATGQMVSRTTAFTTTTGTEPAVNGGVMPKGLRRRVTYPDNTEIRYDYNAAGDLITETGPYPIVNGAAQTSLGVVRTRTYDEVGRVSSLKETSDAFPGGVTTSYTYDRRNAVTTQTKPRTTDAVNNRAHQRKTTMTYDPNGNLDAVEVSDVGGSSSPDVTRTTTRTYDTMNRPVRISAPATALVTRTYDEESNVKTETVGSITTSFDYTARDELWKATLVGFVRDPITPSAPQDLFLGSRSYDGAGRLATTIDANNNQMDYTYADADWLSTITLRNFKNPDNTTRDVVLKQNLYDAAGHITDSGIAGSNPFIKLAWTHFDFDQAGRVSATNFDPWAFFGVPGLNRHSTYTYDAMDRVTQKTISDANRSETTAATYEYHGLPKTVSVDPNGLNLTTTFDYDTRGIKRSITDPTSAVTTYTSDEIGRRTTQTGAEVNAETASSGPTLVHPTSTTGYDTFGEPVATKDPNGNITTQQYDAAGRPTTTGYPTYDKPAGGQLNVTSTIGYDTYGNATTFTDRLGHVFDVTVDMLGRPVRLQAPSVDGSRPTLRWAYDNNGNRTQTTDEAGISTVFAYDMRDRLVSTQLAEQYPNSTLTTKRTLDDAGNVIRIVDPANVWKNTAFNAANEPTSETTPAPNGAGTVMATYTRDVAGRLTRVTDLLNRHVDTIYDLAGRPTSVQRFAADGSSSPAVTTTYDMANRKVSVTDSRLNTMTAVFDAGARLISTTRPVDNSTSITETYGHDANGNRTRVTDGNTHTFYTTYQPWNLPEKEIEPSTPVHPSLSDRTWTTTYNELGLPGSLQEPGGVTRTRTFDDLGRLTSETGTGAEANTSSRTIGYDAKGRVTSYGTPTANATVLYNSRDLPRVVTDPANTTTYDYDAAGRVLRKSGGVDDVVITRNAAGNVATEKHNAAPEVATWDYYSDGKPKSRGFGTGKVARTWEYDKYGRLSTEKYANGSVLSENSYTYDDNDNVATKTIGPASAPGAGQHAYTYDFANRITKWTDPSAAETPYEWDGADNRKRAGAVTYIYDERNRLTTSVNGATTTTYGFSARGNLTSTQVGNGPITTQQYDAFDRLVTDGAATYNYDSLDRVRTRNGVAMKWEGATQNLVHDGSQQFTYGAEGQPLRTYTGASYKELATNAHGDVTGSYTANQTIPDAARAFDPWGKITSQSGPNPSLGYQGDWTDPTTGRVDMNARWYTPDTGSLASRDELSPASMKNRYGYTPANPLTATDPTGYTPVLKGDEAFIYQLDGVWRVVTSSGVTTLSAGAAAAALTGGTVTVSAGASAGGTGAAVGGGAAATVLIVVAAVVIGVGAFFWFSEHDTGIATLAEEWAPEIIRCQCNFDPALPSEQQGINRFRSQSPGGASFDPLAGLGTAVQLLCSQAQYAADPFCNPGSSGPPSDTPQAQPATAVTADFCLHFGWCDEPPPPPTCTLADGHIILESMLIGGCGAWPPHVRPLETPRPGSQTGQVGPAQSYIDPSLDTFGGPVAIPPIVNSGTPIIPASPTPNFVPNSEGSNAGLEAEPQTAAAGGARRGGPPDCSATKGPETFYRTMSKEHADELAATGRLPATAETFISPSAEFSAAYDGTMVQFTVRAGTTDALAGLGVRDASAATSGTYPGMPSVSSGWTKTSAFFKGEGGTINIGLGRGDALDLFNDSILGFRPC